MGGGGDVPGVFVVVGPVVLGEKSSLGGGGGGYGGMPGVDVVVLLFLVSKGLYVEVVVVDMVVCLVSTSLYCCFW